MRWLLFALLATVAGRAEASEPTFAEVVARHFHAWDLNRDGRLDVREIDRLMNDPTIRDEAAAALATIKVRERHLTEAERRGFAQGLDELRGESGSEAHSPESPGHGTPIGRAAPYNYESHYRRLRTEAGKMSLVLFAHGHPDFRSLRQGGIGDCFFFSVIGTLAALHPGRIVSMIEPEPRGGYVVHFPEETPIRVPPLTQAEALVNNTASTLEDGLWPVVLEKAMGEALERHAKAGHRTAEPTDAIANGGSTGRTMRFLTGHASHEYTLRRPQHAAETMAEMRHALARALESGRLATASMGHSPAGPKKIPKLGYGHGYGVLGFDPRTDELTLWNPWGDTFTPDGPEGVEHGFVTEHGVFRVPMKLFYDNFSNLHVESIEVLAPKDRRP